MTAGGPRSNQSRSDEDRSDLSQEEPHVVFRDKRRIDPSTGEVRDPFPVAGGPGDPTAAAQPISAQITADSEEFARMASDLAERTADLQRITAEYANYRKRVDRDRELLISNAKSALAGELLSVLDDLELAERHGDLTGAFKSVADRLVGVLQRAGLEGFGAEGDAFDPAHHEAVQFSTSPEVDAPTVTAVLRRGYSFKDRPLRAAVVAVTGPEHESASAATTGDQVSTADTPASEAADAEDRADDARARSEQESKTGAVPDLGHDQPAPGATDDRLPGSDGAAPVTEDPA